MNQSTNESFPIPMKRSVLLTFFLAVAAIAGITAWAFASGLAWSGICMIVVGVPLALLFWYMLHVNPSRAWIILDETGLNISTPPFLNEAVPYGDILEASRIDLKEENILAGKKPVRGMRWGNYRVGKFALESGGEAIVAANSSHALALKTDVGVIILGPQDVDGLEAALGEKIS